MTNDTAVGEETLAEGYRRRAERARPLVDEFEGVSREAYGGLGDAPDW